MHIDRDIRMVLYQPLHRKSLCWSEHSGARLVSKKKIVCFTEYTVIVKEIREPVGPASVHQNTRGWAT